MSEPEKKIEDLSLEELENFVGSVQWEKGKETDEINLALKRLSDEYYSLIERIVKSITYSNSELLELPEPTLDQFVNDAINEGVLELRNAARCFNITKGKFRTWLFMWVGYMIKRLARTKDNFGITGLGNVTIEDEVRVRKNPNTGIMEKEVLKKKVPRKVIVESYEDTPPEEDTEETLYAEKPSAYDETARRTWQRPPNRPTEPTSSGQEDTNSDCDLQYSISPEEIHIRKESVPEKKEAIEILGDEIENLPVMEKRIVNLYGIRGLTQNQVAKVLGVDRTWISKQYGKICKKLSEGILSRSPGMTHEDMVDLLFWSQKWKGVYPSWVQVETRRRKKKGESSKELQQKVIDDTINPNPGKD